MLFFFFFFFRVIADKEILNVQCVLFGVFGGI